MKRTRLFSTSDCSVSRSAPATSSAASSVQPPAKTESARKRRCSSSGREVVAPRDRRPERLLPRIGVAAALQQVEALGEPLQDLRGRECPRAGGGELDREREVVEARAELGDLVPSHRAASARRRARRPPRRRAVGLRTRLRPGRAGARGSSRGAPGWDRTARAPKAQAQPRSPARGCRGGGASPARRCAQRARPSLRASARSCPSRARARGGRRARPRRHPPCRPGRARPQLPARGASSPSRPGR